jgi:glycosyltransferase involved in cell wall biosynthesis
MKTSVLIPTFNRPKWLRESLDSVLAQDVDMEVIVLDHGSTEDTAHVLNSYGDQLRRFRIEVNRSDPRSPYHILSEFVTGDYVVFFTDDDHMQPENLSRKAQLLDSRPEVLAVSSDAFVINEAGQRAGVSTFSAVDTELSFGKLFVANQVAMPSVVFRRAMLEHYPIAAHYGGVLSDWAFWLEIASRGVMARIPEPLIDLRLHMGSHSSRDGAGNWEFTHKYPAVWKLWIERGYKPKPQDWELMFKTECTLVYNSLNCMRESCL